jgi:hypothetical protein
VDAGRAGSLAVDERDQNIGQLRVAVFGHELRHVVAPAPAARLADDRQVWLANVGKGERTVAGQGD